MSASRNDVTSLCGDDEAEDYEHESCETPSQFRSEILRVSRNVAP